VGKLSKSLGFYSFVFYPLRVQLKVENLEKAIAEHVREVRLPTFLAEISSMCSFPQSIETQDQLIEAQQNSYELEQELQKLNVSKTDHEVGTSAEFWHLLYGA
jgi:hypothetical protein